MEAADDYYICLAQVDVRFVVEVVVRRRERGHSRDGSKHTCTLKHMFTHTYRGVELWPVYYQDGRLKLPYH